MPTSKKHSHYFKSVAGLTHVDVYRVLHLFNVTDPCIQHAVKKLLVAGGRGAGKSIEKDVKEAIDSLVRWQEMRDEDVAAFETLRQELPPFPEIQVALPTVLCTNCQGRPCMRLDGCPYQGPSAAPAGPVAPQTPAGQG